MIVQTRKYQDVETNAGKILIKGHFTIHKCRTDGTRQKVADFDNLFLNEGLNRFGSTLQNSYCFVGTGTTPPDIYQTTLVAQLGWMNLAAKNNGEMAIDDDGISFIRTTFSYKSTLGAVVGTIAEIGVGNNSGVLVSRALILDDTGQPTTITITSTEYLEVDYSLGVYPPLGDLSGTVTISGIQYEWTSRALGVQTAGYWNVGPTSEISLASANVYRDASLANNTATSVQGYSLGSINLPREAYQADSLTRYSSGTLGQGAGNHANGISGFTFNSRDADCPGLWQMIVSPPIPKNADRVLNLRFGVSWGRKT